ncbi:hypothetical protein K3169_13795 [Pseudomonas phytophila]|uniref:Uncharacterized protein n=1 Tax=Pseudomonas phytophila TaxID=2867264 RepID=A0ABY6FMV0_9PSED|nr:hypothetical protein [Pseudomonas phytophila]UXZ98856.1 hypothetical protein K3169_13795 [Pseudomonas phytophila]
MAKVLAWVGVIATTAYLLCIWWLVGDRIHCLKVMELNEVGDFLAGAFGPLAILWLVLGFFQQGVELRQGTQALLLQAKELKESVNQQTYLVEAQNRSLQNHEQSLEPLLSLTYVGEVGGEGEMLERFKLTNDGQYCEAITVQASAGERECKVALEPLIKGESREFYLDYEMGSEINVSVYYNRGSGRQGMQLFTLTLDYDGGDYWYSVSKKPTQVLI